MQFYYQKDDIFSGFDISLNLNERYVSIQVKLCVTIDGRKKL
jgi:hypothetical protein